MSMITSGDGKYNVWLEHHTVGGDILLILGGGTQPHIGGIVICKLAESPKIISFEGHHDVDVLTPLAEAACKKYKTTVIAIGGIHIDNATKKEIKIIINNCNALIPHL